MGPKLCILQKKLNQKVAVEVVRLRERRLSPIMISFKSFLSEQKNTHMTHLDDAIIYGGVSGARQAINAIQSFRDMLQGHHSGSVSVKWDGAPAIFAGTDPSDGKFFVAKKGIFAKNPKVYKTPQEIDADTSGDLAAKLKLALQHLPSLGIKGVIQGDFLFAQNDLKKDKIDGEDFITFHPNTIVYAVPANTTMAKDIASAKLGIVWHTTYKGSTFESMRASYGVNVNKFRSSSAVWSQDAFLRDLTNATMSESETKMVNAYLSVAGKIFNKISGSTLRELEANPELQRLIEQYNNTFVRGGQVIQDTAKHTNNLILWIQRKFHDEISQLKTEKGKTPRREKLANIMTFFSPRNKISIKLLFDFQKAIIDAKLIIINILNRLSKVKTFVRTNRGYKTTGPEGYVAIDKLSGSALKIVDRMEFSNLNFSPDIIKGWNK